VDRATSTIADWLQYCKLYYSPSTLQNYAAIMHHVNAFLTQSEKNLLQASSSDILSFANHYLSQKNCRRVDEKIKARSANVQLTAIKSFFRWYAKQDNGFNPAAEIAFFKEQPAKQRCLSVIEYKSVLDVAKPIERDAIQFLCNTGLRAAEFRAIRPEHINKDLKYISILGKGNKSRIVPLNQVVRDIISKSPHLPFVERFHGSRQLYTLCEKLSYRAKIPRFGPHACRHFFATRLIVSGVPTTIVAKILGHSSSKFTERVYCHLAPTDILGVTEFLRL